MSKFSDVLARNGQHLDNVLETLELQQHSLGILAVLCAKFSNFNTDPTVDFEPLYDQIQEFILGCNGEQVRFATELCKFNHGFYLAYLIVYS